MAVETNPDVVTPQSTGAVELDTSYNDTQEQVVDNTSTGAVSYQEPGTTTADWHGADAVVNFPTSEEPVTFSQSWIDQAQGKQVTPAGDESKPKKTAKAKQK